MTLVVTLLLPLAQLRLKPRQSVSRVPVGQDLVYAVIRLGDDVGSIPRAIIVCVMLLLLMMIMLMMEDVEGAMVAIMLMMTGQMLMLLMASDARGGARGDAGLRG